MQCALALKWICFFLSAFCPPLYLRHGRHGVLGNINFAVAAHSMMRIIKGVFHSCLCHQNHLIDILPSCLKAIKGFHWLCFWKSEGEIPTDFLNMLLKYVTSR